MTSKNVYDYFRLQFNKLDTNYSQELSSAYVCALFNKAQYKFIDANTDKEEATKMIQSDLQSLLAVSILTGVHIRNVCEVVLPDDWYYIKRVSAIDAQCGNTLSCLLVQEGNIGRLLQNSNKSPSVEWEETIYTLGADNLRIYVDNFSIKEVECIYYKDPVHIDIQNNINGGLNFYGLPSANVDPLWIDAIVHKIIDIAVLLAATDEGDVQLFQIKSQLLKL